EVGVDRQRRVQLRRDLVEHVELRFVVRFSGPDGPKHAAARDCERRYDVEAAPLPQTFEALRGARHAWIDLAVARGPRDALVAAAANAIEVDAPRGRIGIEAERLERDADLGGPAVCVALRLRFPDAIPVAFHVVDVLEKAFPAD